MKRIIPFLFTLLWFSSCEEDINCDASVTSIESLINLYNQSLTMSNCIAMRDAIETYLHQECASSRERFEVLIDGLICGDEVTSTCDNGIRDGNETGVDCGGSCKSCDTDTVASCFDRIKNGDETEVDCGGSCDPCPTSPNFFFKCEIDFSTFNGNTTGFWSSYYDPLNSELLVWSGSLNLKEMRFNFYDVPEKGKTYRFIYDDYDPNATDQVNLTYSPMLTGLIFYRAVDNTGSVTITEYDTINKYISGTFFFDMFNSDDTTDIKEVREGEFVLPID